MEQANPISSPMIGGCKLTKQGSDLVLDASLCHSFVGALQYVSITQLEISLLVNVCQFMSNVLEKHWTAVK